MQYVGFLVMVLALVAVAVGFLQRRKLGKIIATPFKKTGEAAGVGGDVSCEGEVQAITPLNAPCSGRPCLYYEIEIKQTWEKQVRTADGTKKKTGSRTAHTSKAGSTFHLDDGSGPVKVEAGDSINGTFDKSFEGKGAGQGHLTYGQYQVQIGSPTEGHATGTKCVERIIPAEGRLFVLGKMDDATVKKRDGMMGKLLLSTKGRDSLMGATKRNMMIAFIAGGLMFPTGGGMAIFGEAPAASTDGCGDFTNSIADACQGRIRGRSDVIMTWTITEPGTYRFVSVGTGTDLDMRLWPAITVVDSNNTPIFSASAVGGAQIERTSREIPTGTYTVRINDASSGYAAGLEGGAGFSFDVDIVTPSGGGEAAPGQGATPTESESPAQ